MNAVPKTVSDAYQVDGYCILPERVIEKSLIDSVLQRIAAVMRGEYDTGLPPWRCWNVGDPQKIQKIDQIHLTDRLIFELVCHSAIAEWAAEVTQADMLQVWATQLFYKPCGGGQQGNIGWHTDQQNWAFWQGDVFTLWLALTDVSLQSGPLRFIQGSHRWGVLNAGDAYEQDLNTLQQSIMQQAPAGSHWQEVPALLPAGGMSLHQSQLWHGSGENTSKAARCSIAINLRTANAKPVSGVEDFGYCRYLNKPDICPVIYRR